MENYVTFFFFAICLATQENQMKSNDLRELVIFKKSFHEFFLLHKLHFLFLRRTKNTSLYRSRVDKSDHQKSAFLRTKNWIRSIKLECAFYSIYTMSKKKKCDTFRFVEIIVKNSKWQISNYFSRSKLQYQMLLHQCRVYKSYKIDEIWKKNYGRSDIGLFQISCQ